MASDKNLTNAADFEFSLKVNNCIQLAENAVKINTGLFAV